MGHKESRLLKNQHYGNVGNFDWENCADVQFIEENYAGVHIREDASKFSIAREVLAVAQSRRDIVEEPRFSDIKGRIGRRVKFAALMDKEQEKFLADQSEQMYVDRK